MRVQPRYHWTNLLKNPLVIPSRRSISTPLNVPFRGGWGPDAIYLLLFTSPIIFSTFHCRKAAMKNLFFSFVFLSNLKNVRRSSLIRATCSPRKIYPILGRRTRHFRRPYRVSLWFIFRLRSTSSLVNISRSIKFIGSERKIKTLILNCGILACQLHSTTFSGIEWKTNVLIFRKWRMLLLEK